MFKLPGNFKGKGKGICPLCEKNEGNTEYVEPMLEQLNKHK